MAIEGQSATDSSEMSPELNKLTDELVTAQSKKHDLEEEQKAAIFLTFEEENALAQLDDQIDAIDTEIEYLSSAMCELEGKGLIW